MSTSIPKQEFWRKESPVTKTSYLETLVPTSNFPHQHSRIALPNWPLASLSPLHMTNVSAQTIQRFLQRNRYSLTSLLCLIENNSSSRPQCPVPELAIDLRYQVFIQHEATEVEELRKKNEADIEDKWRGIFSEELGELDAWGGDVKLVERAVKEGWFEQVWKVMTGYCWKTEASASFACVGVTVMAGTTGGSYLSATSSIFPASESTEAGESMVTALSGPLSSFATCSLTGRAIDHDGNAHSTEQEVLKHDDPGTKAASSTALQFEKVPIRSPNRVTTLIHPLVPRDGLCSTLAMVDKWLLDQPYFECPPMPLIFPRYRDESIIINKPPTLRRRPGIENLRREQNRRIQMVEDKIMVGTWECRANDKSAINEQIHESMNPHMLTPLTQSSNGLEPQHNAKHNAARGIWSKLKAGWGWWIGIRG